MTTSRDLAAVTDPGRTDVPSPALPKRSLYLAVVGLMLGMLLGMLDNLIVGTALPTIVGDLGGLAHLSWVVTAYVLASAAATPLWGKIGDLFGRKGAFLTSIVVFLTGSMLTGLADTMGQLIGFRALQGLAAGGLMVGAMAIISDLVPPRERGKVQGVIGAMMPVAFVGGPLLGGFLTDHLSWRWAFYVNVPVGALALLVVAVGVRLPARPADRARPRIDYLGAALLTVGITSLTLVASWGGTQYPWGSVPVVSLAAVAVSALAAFGYAERRAVEPILPPRLFRDPNFTVAQLLSFLVGATMFAAMTFLPQYLQNVRGASPTSSGLLLLPLLFGMLATQLGSGQLIARTGRYRPYPIVGGALMIVGMLMLLGLGVHTGTAGGSALTVGVGLGIGFVMQSTMIVTMNSAPQRDAGAASGSATLFRTIGGSLGVALFGSVYTGRVQHTLTTRLGAARGPGLATGSAHVPPSMVHTLPAPVRDAFAAGQTSGLHAVAIGGAVLAAVAFVLSWRIREVPLRTRAAAAYGASAKTTAPAA